MTSSSPPTHSPISSADLETIRAALPAVSGCAYLNAGTLGPLPQVAIDAMQAEHQYDVQQRQCGRLWERLAELQASARGAVAALTGVSSEKVALMHSTHEGMNTCLWGMSLQAGDVVVTTNEEHPGLLVPLRHVRDRLGVEVRIAEWVDDDAAFVENIASLVDERTRAVALSHVSWVSGRVAPLRALKAALPPDVRIIVDGAQSAGVLLVDPSDGWDAYSVSGQKWPCGPNGTGGLALVDPERWLPTYGGFLQVADPADCMDSALHIDGRRFETSQESMAPLAGFAASVDWLVREVGLWRAERHAAYVNARARVALADAGFHTSGACHLLVVEVPTGRAPTIVEQLCERDISIRPLGLDHIRISLGAWTNNEEVDSCVDAVIEFASAPR